MKKVRRFLNSEVAATIPEYAIILALIAIACVTAIGFVGGQAGGMWGESATELGTTFEDAGVGR